ncbi:MAG: hypothetical protein HYY41_02030 [Chloroflexi bacterium]|nr:hypothetical protein [Chloroflexota bacterium]MBI2979593.1 hypothetical protein [Chloroflexota bacterium]
MAQQQGIVKGDALQKLGSAGFIIGAILLVIFNILLPRAADPSNVQEMLKKMGGQEALSQVSALLIAVGTWAVMIGTAGVYRSISAGGAAWARLGFYGTVVGTAMWTVSLALHMATAGAAANWMTAPAAGQATAYSVAAALSAAGLATFSMTIIVVWLALIFLGIGMVLSTVYPRWLGWVVIVLGIATVVAVGLPQAFAGISSTLNLIFMALSLLTTLWILVIGIWVARKAW